MGTRGPQCEAHRQRPDRCRGRGAEAARQGAGERTCTASRQARTQAGREGRQTARQLERGKLPVEARLDLHGMRQREAHAALRRFLKAAQGQGYRHVLVITGKGAAADTTRPFYQSEERGVLRQAVPHWLAQPDLAHVVVSFSEAPRRLGGEGALYVRLRKARVTK